MSVRKTYVLTLCLLLVLPASGQGPAIPSKRTTPKPSELESTFFAIIRDGDALQFLSYIPEDGVHLGRSADHTARTEVEEQLTKKTGLYCKLFDSSCLARETTAGACSYRELLTKSEKVRTASTETTRNNVRQAILVAQIQNEKCGGAVLIDFIFNDQKGGWKLFSIP